MYALLPIPIAAALSLVMMPIIILIADKQHWFDEVNSRKIHTGNIPRLGGIGIFWSFAVTMALAIVFVPNCAVGLGKNWWLLIAPVIAILVIHFIGLADDFQSLRARFKFMLQIGAAILVVACGFYFKRVYLPIPPYDIDLGWGGRVLTVIWIVGITNAINLIDGMDGLSSGISIIAAATFGTMYLLQGELFPATIAFALVGALIGFLCFNFPPAKIFMGDSGSTFLGFVLALLTVFDGNGDGYSEVGLLSAITVLIIPVFDTFAAMIRRRRNGISFLVPDRLHLHHKMLNLGLGVRSILAIVYAVCILLGATAISTLYLEKTAGFILQTASWAVCLGLFILLHYLQYGTLIVPKDESAITDESKE
jgi:UDP-GlcNAc:undecaprenyl-phosphate/decaprenyl-phosphate GlcNAc-1-phosphate transferase